VSANAMEDVATTWVRIRSDYAARWPKVTFTELAEEHGVSRAAIGKRAKRERWAYRVRVIRSEKAVRRADEELVFYRRQATEIARAVLAFTRDKRITLEQLAAEAREAGMGITFLWSAAFHVAHARQGLEGAKADRWQRGPVTHAMRDLSPGRPVSGGKGVPGRWPMYGYGPREPWPWEKRRRSERA
jgi:hypothetical protein